MSTKRIHWIDALRVIVVLLIFAFHSARIFDSLGTFYAKSPEKAFSLSVFVGFLNIWQMPLLFLLAGMSTSLALGKRSARQYLDERLMRLLVPFVFGILVIVPPQAWYGARTNSYYRGSLMQFYGDYFSLKWGAISDYFGGPSLGHLWFIGYLFVLAVIALPLFLWLHGRGAAVRERLARMLATPGWWPALAFVLLLTGAFPDLGGHNPLTFLVWLVIGFIAATGEALVERVAKWRWMLLGTGGAIAVPVLLTYDVRDRFPDPSVPIAVNEYFFQLAAWLLCLAAIGIAATYLDRPRRHLPYLAEASYPTYILHQTVIIVLGFYLVRQLPHPLVGWALLTVASIAVTYGIYELLVRRVPPLRILFGMKRASREPA